MIHVQYSNVHIHVAAQYSDSMSTCDGKVIVCIRNPIFQLQYRIQTLTLYTKGHAIAIELSIRA